jgi:TonB-linked SusC/RagA family outer membrane protein
MKKNLLLLLSLIVAMGSFAQTKVSGKVIDKTTNRPIEGVNIILEKSKKGTSTQKDGSFTINVKSSNSVLIFSCIGYATQTVVLEKNIDTITVAMTPVATDNAEVVVIGYGTQRRADVTGAISKFKDEKLDEAPVSTLDQALQGKIAGLQIQNISSEAGAPPKVTVRGISSIYAGAAPLVVVDGQPVPDGLSYINMADVESVEVLKDAASAAIYGSRGASGVILVTTKSGKTDKPKFAMKYSIGAKTDYKRYDVWSTTQYLNNLYYEAALKAQDPSITPPSAATIATNNERAGYIIENDLRNGVGTDWQSQALRNGLFQNINLTASGGKSDIKYYISGGYQTDQGLMRNSEYNRFSLRTKVDISLSSKVKLVLNLNPSYSRRESPSINYTTFVRYASFMPVRHTAATIGLVSANPQWAYLQPGDYVQPRHLSNLYYAGYMPDGSYWDPGSNSDAFNSSTNSPTSILDNTSITNNEYRLQSSAELTYKLRKGLDFKSLATMYINNSNGLNWANRNAEADGLVSKGVFNNNSFIDLLAEQTLTYTKSIKDHNFNVLAGFTTQTTNTKKDQITGYDFASDNIRTYNNAAIIDKAGTFGTTNKVALISYLGRLNYNFKSKYILSASFRTDGSSYFGPGNKWGTFPSVSAGWSMDKENFMKKVKWVSKWKWRASYGVSGNNRILDFGFLDLLYTSNYAFGNGTGNVSTGQTTSSTIRSNKDITWESTFQANYGLDLGIFRNKIGLSVDYYQSHTDKLLLQQATVAYTGVPASWNNIGSLKNTGIELQLNTVNVSKSNFKWTTAGNISHTENKILELGQEAFLLNEGERNELYLNQVGNPLIQFYGYKTDGIWLSQAEIDAAQAAGLSSNLANVFVPGQLKLVDINGDNVIDPKDRTIIGSPYPDFTWGITNTITYNQFDISFTFQGSQGGSLINGDPNYDDVKKIVVNYNRNRYISPLFPGDGKTPNYNKAAFNWLLTDYVMEDASYYALREVNIGYKFPENKIKKAKFNSLRLYVSAQNLYYHAAKNYRGINPEARVTSGPYGSALVGGYQRGSFPVPQTFVFGVDLNF